MAEIESGIQKVLSVTHGTGRAPTVVMFGNGASAKIWKNQWESYVNPKMEVGCEADLKLETKPDSKGNTETWVSSWGGVAPAKGGGGGGGGFGKGGGISDQTHLMGVALECAVKLAIHSAQGKPIPVNSFIKNFAGPMTEYAKLLAGVTGTVATAPAASAAPTTPAPAAAATAPATADSEYDPFAED